MDLMKNYKTTIFLLLALVFFVACPFGLPTYWTMILTEILIMGLLAMSFNLLTFAILANLIGFAPLAK